MKNNFTKFNQNNMATKAIKKNPVIQEETKTEEMEIISENETKTEINKDEQIEKLKEQVELLMKIADQNKIRQLAPQAVAWTKARVSILDEKLVVSWRTVKDYVKTTKRDWVVEEQIIELTLEDGSLVELSLLDGVRNISSVEVDILETTQDSKGDIYFTFYWKGKNIKMNKIFFNR